MEAYHKSMAALVEREHKLEGKPPLVQFLTSRKGTKKTKKQNTMVQPSHGPNGRLPSVAGTKGKTDEHPHQ
jgi:hypothetical protein